MARLKGKAHKLRKPGEHIPSVTLWGPKGLTREQAYAQLKHRVTDYRGFTYNTVTGKAVFT